MVKGNLAGKPRFFFGGGVPQKKTLPKEAFKHVYAVG